MTEGRHRTVKTGLRHYGRIIAAAAAALGLVLSAPGLQVPARAVDLDKSVEVTITAATELTEITDAEVVLDYYLVAKANPLVVNGTSYDSYEFELVDPFLNIGVDLNIPFDKFAEDQTDYVNYSRDIAQKAAAVALAGVETDDGTGRKVDPSAPPAPTPSGLVATVELGQPSPKLDGGLYLVVPHGKDLAKYVRTIAADKAPHWQDEHAYVGDDLLVTVAYSPTKVYTFSPILLSLPSRQITGTDEQGQPTVTPSHETGEPGEWVYDVKAVVKASEEYRYGKLVITKKLDQIEDREKNDGTWLPADPMTAVFEVIVKIGDTAESSVELYRRNVSIVLDEGDISATGIADSVTLEKIPVGAWVTVNEIYSGASYDETPAARIPGDGTVQITVDRQKPASVEFANHYNNKDHGGGSVTNHAEYGESDWIQFGDGVFDQMTESPDDKEPTYSTSSTNPPAVPQP